MLVNNSGDNSSLRSAGGPLILAATRAAALHHIARCPRSIKAAQEEIQKILAAKPEYVVNTSEFNDVKGRLAMLHNRRKVDNKEDSTRPRLRRAPGTGTGPVDETSSGDQKPDQDERPTLKRRPDQFQ